MENEYKIFYIPKSKGYRKIVTYTSPDSNEYRFHTAAKQSLDHHIRHSKFAKAYIKHRSIITNAQAHLYNDYFICLDICDYFQSINHKRLVSTLYHEINKSSKKQFTLEQCQSLVKSCSVSGKGVAIGLIPSPILANIYLKEFDTKLYAWLKKQGYPNVIYTRYADDITISFKDSIESITEASKTIIAQVSNLLKGFSLELNNKKTRTINLKVSNHVRITGINLTRDCNNYRKLTVGRKRKDKLFFNALEEYKKQGERDCVQKIKGMQSFILSVEGEKYEESFSVGMKKALNQLGFNSLKELVDSL